MLEVAARTDTEPVYFRKAVPLASIADFPPPTFLVGPLLPEGMLSMVYGYGGVGKSLLAQGLAASLALGLSVFPTWQVAQQRSVLILDYEKDVRTWQSHIKAICAAMGVATPEGLLYRSPNVHGNDDGLARELRDLNPDVVMVDPVESAMPTGSVTGDPNERFRSLAENLRADGRTVLFIDHRAKGEGGSSPYGSVHKVNVCRQVWCASGSIDDGMTLVETKSNLGPTSPSQVLAATFDDEGISFKLGPKMDRPETLVALLTASGGEMPKEIAASSLGVSEANLRKIIERTGGLVTTRNGILRL